MAKCRQGRQMERLLLLYTHLLYRFSAIKLSGHNHFIKATAYQFLAVAFFF